MNHAGRKPYGWLLITASWLYGSIVRVRNTLYDLGVFRSVAFDIPVISVGNITVGGTGKTPHVEYLAELLEQKFRIATLSRGYLRKSRGFRLAGTSSTAREIGDEPMQIREHFGIDQGRVVVAVDRKRVKGIRKLKELDPRPEVVLLDDAFQHRAVHPGLSILLIDHSRPIFKDRMLPAGNLREPAGNKRRADILLVTKTPETTGRTEMKEYEKMLDPHQGQALYFTTLTYTDLLPVFPGEKKRTVEHYTERKAAILLVAGIANPLPLSEHAGNLSDRIRELYFPDHYWYNQKDAERITAEFKSLTSTGREVLVLTTEKDAVRLRELAFEASIRSDFHAIRIQVEFLNNTGNAFDHQIIDYVSNNQ